MEEAKKEKVLPVLFFFCYFLFSWKKQKLTCVFILILPAAAGQPTRNGED